MHPAVLTTGPFAGGAGPFQAAISCSATGAGALQPGVGASSGSSLVLAPEERGHVERRGVVDALR